MSSHGAAGVEPITLIATLFNEADSVEAWLRSVMSQTVLPDEVVLVDAGSTDGTVDLLRAVAIAEDRIRVVVEPGLNISEGRNRAVREASHDLIAITDAGTILEPDWFEHLVAPFRVDPSVEVVGGFFRPAGRNDFEKVLAAVITPRLSDVEPDTFLPSSRSFAVRRPAFERVGGYPEWLRSGEDLWLGRELRKAGARFAFAPDAVVAWYPRPTLVEYFRQYRFYARGDGHSLMYPLRQAARYGTYGGGAALFAMSFRHRWLRPLLAVGFVLRQRPYVGRLWAERPFGSPLKMLWATLLVPVIAVVGDVAKMIGYPQGRWQRWRAGGEAGLKEARLSSHRAADTLGDRQKVS